MQDLDRAEELLRFADALVTVARRALEQDELERAHRLLPAIDEAKDAAEAAADPLLEGS